MATVVEPGGYLVQTFEENRSQVVVPAWKQAYGADADTASDSPDGLLIDLLTKKLGAVDERGSEAYQAAYFTTAVGLQLDAQLRPLFNSERAPARGSQGPVILYGTLGTTIVASAEVSTEDRGDVFVVDLPVELKFGDTAVVVFGPAVNDPTFTQINISGVAYPNLAGITGTGVEIASSQKLVMPASDSRIRAINGPYEDPSGNGVLVIELNGLLDVQSTASASQVDDYRGTEGNVTSSEAGEIPGDAGSITRISTPISGWSGVVNIADVSLGALEDTDAQYRQRHLQTLGKNGDTTLLGLKGRLLDIRDNPGVEFVEIFNRPTGDANYLVVVKGGDEDTIATLIWEHSPIGYETLGDLTFDIDDPRAAGLQTVRFSRTTDLYVWADIIVQAGEGFPAEEVSNIANANANALSEFGNTLGISRDIYLDELKQQLDIPGSRSITVRLGVTGSASDPKPAVAANNIILDQLELSLWSASRINTTVTF